jgi:RimJ/RimL family protein N-acetyltransferase
MEIITERLVLREFVESDWESVLAYQREPMYLRYYAWTDRSQEEVEEFISWFITAQHDLPRRRYQLAIIEKETGKLVGNCGLRLSDPPLNEGDIGYEIGEAYWRRGYATEATREMLRLGFESLSLHRVWATCVAENIGSARVLEKLGMRQEGILVERDFYKGKWWDHRLFAILEREWNEQSRR